MRTLVEKRPETIRDAVLLSGSRSGALPALRRALDALDIPVEEVGAGTPGPVEQRRAPPGSTGAHGGNRGDGYHRIRGTGNRAEPIFLLPRAGWRPGPAQPGRVSSQRRRGRRGRGGCSEAPRGQPDCSGAQGGKRCGGDRSTCAGQQSGRYASLAASRPVSGSSGRDGGATQTIYQSRFQLPLALVVGGEGKGLRRLTRELCDETLSIPMRGVVESLERVRRRRRAVVRGAAAVARPLKQRRGLRGFGPTGLSLSVS